MKKRMTNGVLGMLMLAMPCAALAQTPAKTERKPWQPTAQQQEVLSTETFLNAHPDMLNRVRAMDELKRGDATRAANYFRRAAHYADKQSQAAYAEMLWEGRGVERDRAAAYAWMDLAAERGYTLFLAFRERYWGELNEAERKRALEIGEQVYAEYGDSVAKRRMETVLRRAKQSITGSRVGAVGFLTVIIPGMGGGTRIDGSRFYDRQFWEPKRYWQWQGELMEGVKEGRVIVGDLHTQADAANEGGKNTPKAGEKRGE